MENRRIAVIDEDQQNLDELQGVLFASGYDPVVVNNAFLAVELVIQFRPGVILLELRMQRKNGFELAEEMNRVSEAQRIPIIAMSGFFKDEPTSLMNLCGIKRYLRKPIYPLDVIAAIEDVIERK